MINVKEIMAELSSRRKVFSSEADFQLEFAWAVKTKYPNLKIRMEYVPDFDRQMHIDILLMDGNRWMPIELKYKTKGCSLNVDGDVYRLANHSAKDVNCYLYLKDIERIERIERIKRETSEFFTGYTIMLTNEPSYLKYPSKKDCNYLAFSLHEGAVKKGTMRWGKNTGSGTKKGCEADILLNGEYKVHWEEYSRVDPSSAETFWYTCSEIKAE